MPEKRYKITQSHRIHPYIGTYKEDLTKKEADAIMEVLVQTAGPMKYEIEEMI